LYRSSRIGIGKVVEANCTEPAGQEYQNRQYRICRIESSRIKVEQNRPDRNTKINRTGISQ
jgi:hypothetical protein